MKISNTTTNDGFLQRYEYHTQLGRGVVTSDSELTLDALVNGNETIYEMTTEIMLLQDSFDWDDPYRQDYAVATTPLVAGQRDYQFDSISFLKLKRVDVTYDGTNWYRAEAFDSSSVEDGLGNDDVTDTRFTTTAPKYDPRSFGFELYPRATAAQVAAGAKARIEFGRGHLELSSDNLTAELPLDRPFHDLIAVGAAMKDPGITNEQYTKLQNRFGIKQGNGQWTGGMGSLIQHYAQRNEDSFLEFKSDIRSDYK